MCSYYKAHCLYTQSVSETGILLLIKSSKIFSNSKIIIWKTDSKGKAI